MRRELVWKWLYVGIGGDLARLLVEVGPVTFMIKRTRRDLERRLRVTPRRVTRDEEREEG